MQPLPSSGMSCAGPFTKLLSFVQSEGTGKGKEAFALGGKLFEHIWAMRGHKGDHLKNI